MPKVEAADVAVLRVEPVDLGQDAIERERNLLEVQVDGWSGIPSPEFVPAAHQRSDRPT